MKTNSISHNAIGIVTKILPSEKQVKLLNDLATELAINPEDTNLHDIIKLELKVDNLWYKIQDDDPDTVKMGLFIFSENPIPTKLLFALNKLGNTSTKDKHNILNVVAYTLMKMNYEAGGDITDTHAFVKSIILRMDQYTEPKDQHIGGFFGNEDFSVIESILKTVGSYKR